MVHSPDMLELCLGFLSIHVDLYWHLSAKIRASFSTIWNP